MTVNGRTTDLPVSSIFLERWSPRAFANETIEEQDLLTMIEAGRWAASSGNFQSWRFLYARKGTEHWQDFVGVLNPFNQTWAGEASALVAILSQTTVVDQRTQEKAISRIHAFDAGTASGYFALQAQLMGWHAHGMGGFDEAKARVAFKLPEDVAIHAIYAVGRHGDPTTLPERLQEREFPSPRLPLNELAFEGPYPKAVSKTE